MTQFKFDQVHSSLEFGIKHLMVSKVKGTFEKYDVDVTGDISNLSTIKANVKIDVASINTKNDDRDKHLQNEDFFNVEKYPTIEFETTSITETSVTGQLTIAGETHEETFELEYNGVSKNPMTNGFVTGFIVSGKIDREKYGITFNQALDTGGVMLGKEVKFEADAEFEVEDD
ncbi:YceI family protein [Staphylococcus massiliensis]|uniref:YceI family protein n=1 Tax=Staphylococcus massiliensis TaxID=555791 RepID=UPI001EDF3E86|nr:YceI family protein [Staphylococcus massiliensis]MCG3401853.1 YceI family protein [Staphylococcus massiliensis]